MLNWTKILPTNYNPVAIIGSELINAHLTLEGISGEESLLTQYAGASVDYTEHSHNKPCVYCEYICKLNDWPIGALKLDLENIDYSVDFIVKNGNIVLSSGLYVVDDICQTILFDTENLPVLDNHISITVKAGYSDWPASLKQVALIYLASFYEDRSDIPIKATLMTDRLQRKLRTWNA